MRRSVFLLIILGVLLMITGCDSKVNIDKYGLKLALCTGGDGAWYIENGERYDVNTAVGAERIWSSKNAFFVGDKNLVVVLLNRITFFDTETKQTIREINTERPTYAAKCGNAGDLFIISNSTLYYYSFEQNLIKFLHQFAQSDKFKPVYYSKIAYCRERNSLFFSTTENNRYGIYEMSLDNYQIIKVLNGRVPVYVEAERRLYFISEDEYRIQYTSIDDFTVTDFWQGEWKLVDIDVESEDFIWIIHLAKKPLLNGLVLNENKILAKKFLLQPYSEKFGIEGSFVDISLDDDLKQKLSELVEKRR